MDMLGAFREWEREHTLRRKQPQIKIPEGISTCDAGGQAPLEVDLGPPTYRRSTLNVFHLERLASHVSMGSGTACIRAFSSRAS